MGVDTAAQAPGRVRGARHRAPGPGEGEGPQQGVRVPTTQSARGSTPLVWRLCRVLERVLAILGLLSAVSVALAATPAAPSHHTNDQARLRVVGGLGALRQFTQWEEPFWTRDLQRLSGGRYSAEIMPYDRAGIPEVETLRLLQLGVLSFATVSLDAMAPHYPQYIGVDLAGLNLDMASLRTSLASFRPYLERALREQQGVELLAVYAYPAQVLFCKQPLRRLDELAGRHVRVASNTQADFVAALGAHPLRTSFRQIMETMERGGADCAITGTSTAATLGLQQQARYRYALPLGWGLTVFAANSAAWKSLPADLQQLLRRELPQLEARIWRAAEQDTTAALQCTDGKAGPCSGTQQPQFISAPLSAPEHKRSQEVFMHSVLPRWLMRCSIDWASLWRKTVGQARGIALPALP